MNRLVSLFLCAFVLAGGLYAQTPPAPTELHVSPMPNGTMTGAYLTWHASTANLHFRIYRSANDSSSFSALTTTTARSYSDLTILRGTRYFYCVKSYRDSIESERSNIASILIAPLPPLPVPSNLTATLVSGPNTFEASVKLLWNGGRGPWSYRIYRSTNDTAHYRSYANTADTTFLDRSVRADSTYYYFVRAAGAHDSLGAPSNVASIHVVLPRRAKGIIRGTVIDDSTGSPIKHVTISFFRGSVCSNTSPAFTDSLGHYSVSLDTGRYIIRADVHGEGGALTTVRYKTEYFDNCPEPACAQVVALGDSQTFTANFGLSRVVPPVYVMVSGVVTDTANNPLRNARVAVIRTVQEMNFLASLGLIPGTGSEETNLEGVGHTRGVLWNGRTDSAGRYTARVIGNHSYIALASKEGFLPEYYNNEVSVELADTIAVGTHDTSGINFSLAVRPVPNNSVSGLVRDSLGNGVPSRLTLIPAHHNATVGRYIHTDSLGAYSFTGLPAGKYFVFAQPFSGYGPAFYKDGAYGVRRIQDADTVDVTGNITGINVGVRPVVSAGLAVVHGTVRTNSASIVRGVQVMAFNADGDLISIGVTNASGAYSLDAVEPGVITVSADRYGFSEALSSFVVAENAYTMDNVNLTMIPEGVTSVGNASVAPASYALNQNYPNPFNPSTTISFELPFASKVSLKIYNLIGQEVSALVNDEVTAGTHEIVWNGKDNAGRSVASGLYFYRLNANATNGGKEFSFVKKMLLLK